MAKIKYAKWEIKHFSETEEGRKYLEYNDKMFYSLIQIFL